MTNEFWINDQKDIDELRSFIKDEGFEVVLCGEDGEGNEILEFGDYRVYKPKQYVLEESRNTEILKKYKIVVTDKDRFELEKHIQEYTEIAFDTETDGLNTRKAKMIGFSVCGKAGVSFYYPLYEYIDNELQPIRENIGRCEYYLNLLSNKKLIMWNGSFDIKIVLSNFGINLTEALYIEGMLLKHTVQEEGPFGLKPSGIEIQEFIGLSVEEDANIEQQELKENVESKGGSFTKVNMEMFKADLDILGRYACADADLTKRICDYYLIKLEEEGLCNFYFDEEVMPLYKEVTIPMELNGVELDIDLLIDTKNKIELDLNKLESSVVDKLQETKEFHEWLLASAKKAFPVKYTGKFAQYVVKLNNLDLPLTATGSFSLSASKLEKLPASLAKSFLLREDLDYSDLNLDNISLSMWRDSKESVINISSKSQMGDLVFNHIKIEPLTKTEKGSPQFNSTFIDSLDDKVHEWAPILKDYNRLVKIKTSYIDRFLENNEVGKYYFSYKQHGTISGRYGSDAQQLPRPKEDGQESPMVLKYNNIVRKLFISGKDRVFIDCDYESLEPHVFAHVSGDQGIIDIFKKGHDFYSTIAIATEGLTNCSADKTAENYLGKVNAQKRQQAKTYALGIPYGMGSYALGKDLGIPTEEAGVLRNKYLNAYKDLKAWMNRTKSQVQKIGFVKSEAGRVRHLQEVKRLYSIHKDALMSFPYRRKLLKEHDLAEVNSWYKAYKKGINNSMNFQIQSMAASIVNRAAIRINRELKKRGIDGYCCAQIHDQLITNVPEEHKDECKVFIQDIMENTTKLSLELKAPPEVATNWRDSH
jgi:DNA polymerase I-like protein with 3'-5' exonuclease and polymerase domains